MTGKVSMINQEQTCEAVSYTHLDVYKRQVRGRAGMCAQNAVGVEAVSIEKVTGNGRVIHAKISSCV